MGPWVTVGGMIVGALAGVHLLAFLCTRLPRTIANRSVFGRRTVDRARAAADSWREQLAQQWAQLRAGLRNVLQQNVATPVMGAMGFVIWPLIVCFNTLLLAQILELFVGAATELWEIPGVGGYQPVAVVLAVIVALAEVIFAVAAWKGRSIPLRVFGILCCIVTVLFESWGAWLRALLIMGSEPGSNATIIDLTLTQWSPRVAALIGFFAPAGEMVASVLAFEGIILMAPIVLRLAYAGVLWVLTQETEFLFAPSWDMVTILSQVQERQDETRQLVRASDDLCASAQTLATDSRDLAQPPLPEPDLTAEDLGDVNELLKQFDALAEERLEHQSCVLPAAPSPHMTRPELRRYARHRRNQLEQLERVVQQPVQVAFESLLAKLRPSDPSAPDKELSPWQRVCREVADAERRWHELNRRCEQLAGQRSVLDASLTKLLEMRQLRDLEPVSREQNEARIATALQCLDSSPGGVANLLSQADAHLLPAKDTIEAAAARLQAHARAASASVPVEGAPSVGGGWEAMPPAERLKLRQAEFDITVSDIRSQLGELAGEAAALLRRCGLLGRMGAWLGRTWSWLWVGPQIDRRYETRR